MTPALSNTCYDAYKNCKELAEKKCWNKEIRASCKLSCGLCEGNINSLHAELSYLFDR